MFGYNCQYTYNATHVLMYMFVYKNMYIVTRIYKHIDYCKNTHMYLYHNTYIVTHIHSYYSTDKKYNVIYLYLGTRL